MLPARSLLAASALALLMAAAGLAAVPGRAASNGGPQLLRDHMTGRFTLTPPAPTATHPEVIEPDTQIEPSIAANPADPNNAVVLYQEGRVPGGGDETNGFATTMDGGRTWTHGELPGLTYTVGGGPWDRASDAVVAFGPKNTVYANSLVFDDETMMGLCSGIAVNVSHDGGLHWSAPAFIQLGTDDCTTLPVTTNDKNWITVDMGQGAGHHYGRVYVVWDRVAPVVYNYCDTGCENASNWLPNFLPISPLQGISAFPVVLQDGGLGVAYASETTPPIAFPNDEPDAVPGSTYITWAVAPAAGSVVWPAPLPFTQTTIPVASQQNVGVRFQRAGGLVGAAVDQGSGTIYIVWEDARFRTDAGGPLVNDAVIIASKDVHGLTWGPVTRVNPGPTNDEVDRYNTAVAVGADGVVHVMYRQRQEAMDALQSSPVIDTYYQQSRDGGQTFSAPIKVDQQATDYFYGAYSRDGLFEGDYDQLATSGDLVYVARDEAYPVTAGEPHGLVYNPNASPPDFEGNPAGCPDNTVQPSCLTHLHQRTWVAVLGLTSSGTGAANAALPAAGRRASSLGGWGALVLMAALGLLAALVLIGRRGRRAQSSAASTSSRSL